MWAILTPAGEELLRAMWPVYAREIRRFFVDVLTEDEAQALSALLTRVHAAALPEQ